MQTILEDLKKISILVGLNLDKVAQLQSQAAVKLFKPRRSLKEQIS
ncbi:hypothetical protein IFO70_29230 [Phormidium tenue FACHB-886]|nr:hypothetical protein [Phormidium tenue FACHB-886]